MANQFQSMNGEESGITIKSRKPPLYDVVFLNDDFTTMEFVVEVLMDIFNLNMRAAERVMLNIHEKGSGIAGTYHYDIAATKAKITMDRARAEGFPLRCTVQESQKQE